MDYNFSQKRHWRRSVWNCVLDRLPVPVRDAVALYLAGPNDEDRPVAMQKGFGAHNLIAIERDIAAARGLREAGVLTLQGDVFDHLMAWRPERPVHAVVLDLCGGFSENTAERISMLMGQRHLQGCVVAVNLLRGRDASGNARRCDLQDFGDRLRAQFEAIADNSRAIALRLATRRQFIEQMEQETFGAGGRKHRGALLRLYLLQQMSFLACRVAGVVDEAGRPIEHVSADRRQEAAHRIAEMHNVFRPQMLSYRSTANQTFDTLVFCVPLKAGGIEISEGAAGWFCDPGAAAPLRRQQAAILAHRTRRAA